MIFRRPAPDPVQNLADRMSRRPGFVGGHRASGWLMGWLEQAMAWPVGCGHVGTGSVEYAYAGRRVCGPCVGAFDDPWCVRCGVDAEDDVLLVQVQQGVVLVVFGLCPACHRNELEQDQWPE